MTKRMVFQRPANEVLTEFDRHVPGISRSLRAFTLTDEFLRGDIKRERLVSADLEFTPGIGERFFFTLNHEHQYVSRRFAIGREHATLDGVSIHEWVLFIGTRLLNARNLPDRRRKRAAEDEEREEKK